MNQEPNADSWQEETIRTVRDVAGSNARTARLVALLLALTIAVGALAWGYQTITKRPNPQVRVNITVTKP